MPGPFDWLQSLLGGSTEGTGTGYAASAPSPDLLQYTQDVLSGKIANQGVLNRPAYDPDKPFAAQVGPNRSPNWAEQAMDVGMGIGPGAIRAYHGSPYSFNRFDMSKIGTGEGAQAFGHGLYFAEAEDVARGYRDALGKPGAYLGGQQLTPAAGSPEFLALKAMTNPLSGGTLPEKLTTMRKFGFNDAANWLEKNHPNLELRPQGHMYEVDINTDPARLLDWDKSLAEQSPEVLTALQQKLGQPAGLPAGYRLRQTGSGDYMIVNDLGMGVSGKGGMVARGRTPEDALRLYLPSGGEIYQGLAQKMGGRREQVTSAGSYDVPYSNEAAASQTLKEAGIPGIKYLDQGSRGAGQGTSNYAMFDPSLVEILRRYGILPPLAGATVGGLLGPSKEK